MKYFENCQSLEEAKKLLKSLARQHHPDMGGSVEVMQDINNQFDEFCKNFVKQNYGFKSADTENSEMHEGSFDDIPEEFYNIIMELLKIDGIVVELIGRWIWISGDTYNHKEQLKSFGCRYAKNKKMWYWHKDEDFSFNRRKMSIDEIRSLHGSTGTFKSDVKKQIA